MQVTLLLFAQARETAGSSSLALELPESATVLDLKTAIGLACPAMRPLLSILRIAINSEYAQDDYESIPEGAELAAIPPVSGGAPDLTLAKS